MAADGGASPAMTMDNRHESSANVRPLFQMSIVIIFPVNSLILLQNLPNDRDGLFARRLYQ
jgi:hypothetical protein